MTRATSVLLSVVGVVLAAKAIRDSPRSEEVGAKVKEGPSPLTGRQRKVVLASGATWALTMLVESVRIVLGYPDRENALFVGAIFLILSAPLLLVASATIPYSHLGGAVQYRRIQRLRELTGIQAVIGGAGLALLLNFEQSAEAQTMLTSLSVWTAASLFHFVLLWAQVRMETLL